MCGTNRRLATGIALLLMVVTARAGTNVWTGGGPFATGLGNRVIQSLAVSSDSKTAYLGTGSGTVFAYTMGAPTATTNAATAVTSQGATLNGTVNAQGSSATVTFQYGPTPAYGSTATAAESPVSGSGDTAVSAAITGLACNTYYYFRVVASGVSGEATGSLVSLHTGACTSQTINFPNPGAQVYGTSPTVTATASSGLPVSFSSSTPGVCTATSAGVLTFVHTGTCTILASQAGGSGYAAAVSVAQTFTVVGASQSISFGAAPSLVVGGTATLAASASSGLAVSYSSLTPGVCSVSGSTVTGLAVGTCTVAANQSGSGGYSAAAQVTQDITVGKGSQTIVFGSAPTVVVGGTGTLIATGGGSTNPVVFASTTPAVCTVAGSTVTGVAAGTCTVTADQAGDANYNAALQVSQNVSVVASPVTTVSGDVGTGLITASISGGGALCSFSRYDFSATLPATAPAGAVFPHGVFGFTLSDCVGPVTLTMSYPTALPTGSVYMKYGPTTLGGSSNWYSMPGASASGTTASFILTDGALGDDDLTANGSIVDAGGPALLGAGAVAAIPTLSEWGLILIGLLLGVAGVGMLASDATRLKRNREEDSEGDLSRPQA